MKKYIKASNESSRSSVENMFFETLNAINTWFKGDCKFECELYSVYGATYSGFYKDDADSLMYDLRDMIDANPDCYLVEQLSEYTADPLYQAIINDNAEAYIEENISGMPLDADSLAAEYVDFGMLDEWWEIFFQDAYRLGKQICDSICRYLTNFSMNIEDTEELYEEDFYDWVIEYK